VTYTRTRRDHANEARFNATRFSFNDLSHPSQTNFGIPKIQIEAFGLPGASIVIHSALIRKRRPASLREYFEFREHAEKGLGQSGLSFGVDEIRKEQTTTIWSARTAFILGGSQLRQRHAALYQIRGQSARWAPVTQRYFRSSTVAASCRMIEVRLT